MNFWSRLWVVVGINLGVSLVHRLEVAQAFGTALLSMIVVYGYARIVEALERERGSP